ncbi:MAG: adenosylmethionine--8-amino-7-oxononanoate transaminase [Cyclobacteriaceae bacterium]
MNNLTDINHIWHPFTPLLGGFDHIKIKEGKGAWLVTEDDRKILDAVSSWWVNIHGHANEKIARAIYKQAQKLEQVIFAGFTHDPAIKLTENLLSILPKNQKRVFFSDDGSTSVEVALKLAIQYWHNQGIEKKRIIAIEGAYHGDTFGAMSTADRGAFNKPFWPLLFDVEFIELPTHENFESVRSHFQALVAEDDVAAFIFEPLVQGAGGMRMYSPEALDNLLEIAIDHKVVCIADEVMTGFGRTGKYFSSDHLHYKPDIFCLSKGITGGFLPMGVTVASERIEAAFKTDDFTKTFFHGHSYTANPIACAAANASFEILTSEECQENIKRISTAHSAFASKIEAHTAIDNIRQQGTILAIELKSDESSYMSDLRKRIYPFFLERNILLRPLGNVIYILPPYVISADELDLIYQAIEEFLATMD